MCLLRQVMAEARFERLIYLSSTRVYGSGGGDTPVHEAMPLMVDSHSGSDLYNLSKLMGESLCLHGSQGRAMVVRLSNVIGAMMRRARISFPLCCVKPAQAGSSFEAPSIPPRITSTSRMSAQVYTPSREAR